MNAAETTAGPAVRRTKAKGGAMWAEGTIAGYAFEALVFPEHAGDPAFELDGSRIAKLYIREPGETIASAAYDRGWMKPPANDQVHRAARAVGENLARQLFGN
jgi:hypothetical protein